MMPERIRRVGKLNADDVARLRAVRAEFAARPSKRELLESGQYSGPMNIDEYMNWRKGAGDAPLTKQLQAAIRATGQSLYSIAQASGVAAPVLQRFVNGERGITLDTASKLASYLGLSLVPESQRKALR
jgi:hypothetical protein